MPYCRECGSFLDEGDTFCKSCGEEVLVLTQEEYDELQSQRNDFSKGDTFTYGSPAEYGVPEMEQKAFLKKNYWLWFPFFITWFGLAVYLMSNISDLTNLSQYKRPSEVPSPMPPQAVMLIVGISYVLIPLAIIARPIFSYYKFQRLHDYIKFHPIKQETLPMSGKMACILNALFYILTIAGSILLGFSDAGIVVLVFGIITLVAGIVIGAIFVFASNKWQIALNERIDIIYPETNLG